MNNESQAALDETELPPVAEVEAPVEESLTAEPAPAPEAEPTEDGKHGRFQQRIDRLRADSGEANRRADSAEARAEAAETELTALRSTQPNQAPKLEDFDFDEQRYQSALIDQRVEVGLAARDAERQKATRETEQRSLAADFAEREERFAKEVPDYVDSLAYLPKMDQGVIGAIMAVDDGPKIAYHLATNLDLADDINRMSTESALIRLGQLSAQLSAPQQSIAASAAPDPIEPIVAGGVRSKSGPPGARFE